MSRIFISYRRADSRLVANRIYDRLAQSIGKKHIFKDVDNIPPGRDFRGVLREATANCDVMLVITGPDWIGIKDDKGQRRLDDPNDFVRLEVEAGLQRDETLVIPVLVENAPMPVADDLPDSLKDLAYKNAFTINDDPYFHRDLDALIAHLRKHVKHKASASFDWRWIVGVIMIPIAAAIIGGLVENPSILGIGQNTFTQSPMVESSEIVATSSTLEAANADFSPSPSPSSTNPRALEGLYLQNLISPPVSESSPTLSTVWLAARGEETYTVDSIEVTHLRGGCASVGEGTAIPPAAHYEFTFTSGSREIHALNPALRLIAEDNQDISFTLGLAPEGYFGSVCGRIYAKLFYRTKDGLHGQIVLIPPPEEGVYLSHLLKQNIRLGVYIDEYVMFPTYENIIVSYNGLQLGTDPSIEALDYAPLGISHNWEMIYPDNRDLLNSVIIQENVVGDIVTSVEAGVEIAYDLCAGLLVQECELALTEAAQQSTEALHYLAIRHMLEPSDALSQVIRQYLDQERNLLSERQVIYALVYSKYNSWFETIVAIFDSASSRQLEWLCEDLLEYENGLTASQLRALCP